MPNVACPVCGTEYAGWSVRCAACGTALIPAEDIDPTRLADDEKVVYELGEWPVSVQAEAAQVMAESGIPHAWEDTDLVVHLELEAQVDALLAEVEREAVAAGLLEPSDDDEEAEGEGGEIVYDLSEWGEADRLRLDTRLDIGGVPHVWEGTSLVVAAADELLVEHLLDAVEHPDALDADPGDTDEAAADRARHELLSDLFDAAHRLRRDPGDERGIEELSVVLREADGTRPPYGFPALVWQAAVDLADELGDLLVVAAGGELDDDDDDGDDDDGDAEPSGTGDALPSGHVSITQSHLVAAGDRDLPQRGGDREAEADEGVEQRADAGPDDLDPEEAVIAKATALRDLLRPYV